MPKSIRCRTGEVSCRITEYVLQFFERKGLSTAHLTQGLAYSLEELQTNFASMPWDDYLIFFRNYCEGLTPAEMVELCSSYSRYPLLRPLLSAAGLFFKPVRYFELAAEPKKGAFSQLFRCLEPSLSQINSREVDFCLRVREGYTLPPDLFWQSHAIGLSSVTTHFGLSPSLVSWEPVDRGALYHIRLPAHRMFKFALSWLTAWFRRDTVEDVRNALAYGYERSLLLEQEIEERKRVESTLRETKQWFHSICDSVPGVVYRYVLRPDGRDEFTYVSAGITPVTGLAASEITADATRLWSLIHPDDVPELRESIRVSARDHTNWSSEFRFVLADGSTRWVNANATLESSLGEAGIAWNGIVTDITDHRRTEGKLRAQTAKLEAITTTSIAHILEIDREGTILYANRSSAGRTVADLIGKQVTDFVTEPERSRAIEIFETVFRTRQSFTGEFYANDGNGGQRGYIVTIAPIERTEQVDGLVLTAFDVTEQRLAEARLREQDKLLHKLSDQVPGVIYQFQQWPDGRSCFPYASQGIQNIYEVTCAEVLESAEAAFQRLHPDDVAAVVESIRLSSATMEPWRCEYRVKLSVRGIRWLEGHAVPERMCDGSTLWHGFIQDITDRKLAEEALLLKETAISTSINAIAIASQEGAIIYVNDSFVKLWGYDKASEILGRQTREFCAVEEKTRQAFLKTVENGSWVGELRCLRRDGSPFDAQISANIFRDEQGRHTNTMASFVDVTERKRIAESLRVSEERWKFALEGAGAGVLDWDITSDRILFSDRWREITGYAAGELSESGDSLKAIVHPDDLPAAIRDLEATLQGRKTLHRIEHRLKRADGSWVWIESRSTVTSRGPDGSPLRMIGTHTDITDRKIAEETLRESEARYRRAERGTNDGLWEWNIATGENYFSPRWLELLGYSAGELPYSVETFRDLVHPDDRACVLDAVERHLHNNQPYSVEMQLRCKDGNYLWVQSRGQAERNEAGVLVRMTGSITDISDRRRAQESLRKSEDRLQQAIRVSQFGMFDHDHLKNSLYWSPEQRIIHGWNENDPVTLDDYLELVHPDDREEIVEAIRKAHDPDGAGLFDVEHRILRRTDGEVRWIATRSQTYFDGEGDSRRPVRTVGAVLDFTDRKLAEMEAIQSRDIAQRALVDLGIESARAEQFYRMVEQAGQGIGLAKLDGSLLYMNPAFCKLLEISPKADITQYKFWDLIPEHFQAFLQDTVLSQARDTGTWSGEFPLQTLSGNQLAIFNSVFQFRDSDGEVVGYSNIATDIADLKRIENSLRESEGQLAEAQRIARIGSWSWDAVNNKVWWSDVLYEIFGIDRESTQPSFEAFLEILHPLDRPTAKLRVERMLAGSNEFSNDLRLIRPDGVSIWILSRARAIHDSEGNLIRVDGTDQDISDRKKAELALCASELKYRTLIETSSDAIFQMDLTGRIISANSAAVEMHGYTLEELLSMHMQDLDVPDSAAAVPERMTRLQRGESLTFEVWHHRKDGSTFPLEVIASAEMLDGEWFVLAFDRDITERKRAEEELRKSEERLRLALSASSAVAFVWDVPSDSVIRYFSNEPALPANLHAPESVAAVRAMIHPDDIAVFDAGVAACQTSGADYRNLYRIVRNDGEIRWLEEWGIMGLDGEGKPLQLTGISIDVTDRKEAEQSLVNEKQLLQAVFGSLPGVAYAFDESGRYLRWNHNYEKILGWSDEDMRGLTAIETIAPRDRKRVSRAIQWAFEEGQCAAEFYALTRDGREVPLYISAVRVTLSGKPCLVGLGIDISDRIAAESALRARESQLRTFIESAPAGVAMFDRDLRYISYSRRWLSDYGLGDQNLVGRSHYEVFPEIPERWKAIHQHCLEGNSQQCDEDRFDRANGKSDYLRWEIQPWYEASGAVGGIIFFTESITERVTAEERLRASLREKEAMLKEIHHRVKNNLQVISSLLSLQSMRHTRTGTNEALNESQNRIRAMALVHETLYRSDDLAKVDLSHYLSELCSYLFRAFGVDSSRIKLDFIVQPIALSLDKTITCGLIVNEVVSNSLKHAFPSPLAGNVSITFQEMTDGRLTLKIVDDGIGLPTGFEFTQSSSLGLQLVAILSEQIGGQMSLWHDNGTHFEISFAR